MMYHDSEGKKRILGLIEGGSENSKVVKALLSDLIELGLDSLEQVQSVDRDS